MYCEFVLLTERAEMKESQQDHADGEPAEVIVHGHFAIDTPMPVTQLDGHGLHDPVEEHRQGSPIDDHR